MANFSVPTTGNAYTDVVGFLNNKISDLALMLDPATSSPTNVPTNSIRWSSAANRFEKWDGSAWNAASTLYAITISGNAGTATTLQTARAINGTSFNGGADITTANWGTARTITIGDTGKSVNGSAAVTWTLAELGISAAMQPVVAAASLAAGQTAFGVPSTTGTGASGTWHIDISGNAANCNRTVVTAGLAVGGGTLTGDIAVAVIKADQALAEAGTDDATAMTPLRTAQAIATKALGVNQVWQAVTRVGGTDYQNTTARTIQVSVTYIGRNGKSYVGVDTASYVQVAGTLTALSDDGSARGVHTFLVPPGHFYKLDNATIQHVKELR